MDIENKRKQPMVFCVSGVKNSGKTTLINRLIKEFNGNHYSTAVIKHDGHDFKMDYEDTDTFSFARSGAGQVAIYSEYKYAILHHKKNITIEEIIKKLEPADVIIIEGEKYSPYPKIEVIREEISTESVCSGYHLISIATNLSGENLIQLKGNTNIDIYKLDDIKGIYQRILRYFNKTLF